MPLDFMFLDPGINSNSAVATSNSDKYTTRLNYSDTSTSGSNPWDRYGLTQGEYNLMMRQYADQSAAWDRQLKAERENAAMQVQAQKDLQSMNIGAMQSSANKEMAFNAEQAELTRRFNAEEAQKNREWQEMMSNTAYQRVVKDLQAAGLNPLLAINQGGAVAQSSTPATSQNTYGSHINSSPATASKANSQLQDMSKVVSSALEVLTSKLNRENSYRMQSEYLSAMRSVAQINSQNNTIGSLLRLVGTFAIAGLLI